MVAEVSYEIALRWTPLNLNDDKSTLITWSNVDPVLLHHMASLGHNELKIGYAFAPVPGPVCTLRAGQQHGQQTHNVINTLRQNVVLT